MCVCVHSYMYKYTYMNVCMIWWLVATMTEAVWLQRFLQFGKCLLYITLKFLKRNHEEIMNWSKLNIACSVSGWFITDDWDSKVKDWNNRAVMSFCERAIATLHLQFCSSCLALLIMNREPALHLCFEDTGHLNAQEFFQQTCRKDVLR